ncbi:GTP-binding protein [Lentilactobacillus senioris DSM 24302 = JCM 17472]|uniref:Ribosome biogenesis GTPase A n=1 Tax=Lentilactobacillus senioris DSM 24302 = JCM 17472 TaxID=1423802 RepID=A0A0R2CPX1_9LACO|nr:ribosome biogenesis GTPase YlqF [Lentilactobacillus senioris]KRM93822.1 GTP-binding protein [Lentilactobacillus senioris DSM 24302 = JCM 17472]
MAVTIQWFPGHMAKAIREFEENISLVDIVFELVDARAPYSTLNPEIARISANKPHLYILTKRDLADEKLTRQWLNYFHSQNSAAIAVDAKGKFGVKDILTAINPLLKDKLERELAKGMKPRPIRAIAVGVPNVGKSTVLNRLVKRRAAQVGNRPGVTKGQQWLKADNHLELLDTPGILWPKFQDQLIADKLALTGAIKDSVYHSDDIALFGLEYFVAHYPQALQERYKLTEEDLELPTADLLLLITKNIGMRDDYERASNRIILDMRSKKVGPFTLDTLEDIDNE